MEFLQVSFETWNFEISSPFLFDQVDQNKLRDIEPWLDLQICQFCKFYVWLSAAYQTEILFSR